MSMSGICSRTNRRHHSGGREAPHRSVGREPVGAHRGKAPVHIYIRQQIYSDPVSEFSQLPLRSPRPLSFPNGMPCRMFLDRADFHG